MERVVFDFPMDVHTHHFGDRDAIYNATVDEAMRLRSMPGNRQPYSLSFHPWHIRVDHAGATVGLQALVDALPLCARDPQMIAIGECGLDPKCVLKVADQQSIFEFLLESAGRYNRPTIVHCVTFWAEMMASVEKVWGRRQAAAAWDNGCPIIIHGFRKGPELAKQLTDKGYWLSFGEHFNAEALRVTPADKRFIETDESRLSISEIKALQDQCIFPT